jgi:hypothetical protein
MQKVKTQKVHVKGHVSLSKARGKYEGNSESRGSLLFSLFCKRYARTNIV